jgi:outer membrane protein assembly factor BamA
VSHGLKRAGLGRLCLTTLVACAWLVAEPAWAAVSDSDAAQPTTPSDPEPAEPAPLGNLPSPAELEARGAIIRQITVQPDEIFDEKLPQESGWLYRTANKLHIRTRPGVVREQLLFKPGDRFEVRLIEETERILRANDYLYEAKVTPIAWDGTHVDLEVRTRDVWTLNPGISFSRKGGENDTGVHLEEKNLLGTGQAIKLDWEDNVDRETIGISYSDPHFLHSFGRLGLAYEDADDGETKSLLLDRPFYALDTRLAGGVSLDDSLRQEPRYVLGDEVGEFEHRDEYYEVYGGVSRGLQQGWVTRWTAGMSYERDTFDAVPDEELAGPLPGDRELAYPWIGIEWVQDAYQERRNQDQIVRTEDVLIGLSAGLRLGYASESLGSDRDAWLIRGYLQDGSDLDGRQSIFGSLNFESRLEDGDIANGVLSAEARYYRPTSKRTKFYAAVSGTVTESLDAEQQLLLGGDNGLRGYPLRYQAGTSRALLTLEQRFYTNWYPFRLFHVGAAAFFDMGRTWGRDITGAESLGLLKDVGVGLRFGSSRSSFGNVIHVDLAFPLDGDDSIDSVQIVVETKAKF